MSQQDSQQARLSSGITEWRQHHRWHFDKTWYPQPASSLAHSPHSLLQKRIRWGRRWLRVLKSPVISCARLRICDESADAGAAHLQLCGEGTSWNGNHNRHNTDHARTPGCVKFSLPPPIGTVALIAITNSKKMQTCCYCRKHMHISMKHASNGFAKNENEYMSFLRGWRTYTMPV